MSSAIWPDPAAGQLVGEEDAVARGTLLPMHVSLDVVLPDVHQMQRGPTAKPWLHLGPPPGNTVQGGAEGPHGCSAVPHENSLEGQLEA